MRLSPRLQTAAELCPRGAVLCDVGSDHGKLPAALVEAGVCPSAIATDIGEGPAARAEQTVALCGLSRQISVRRCDGLTGVQAGECTAVSICGLGGEVMEHILTGSPWSLDKTLILQPQSKAEVLRACLYRNGVAIEREVPVLDRGRCYSVMLARRTGRPVPFPDDRLALLLGGIPAEPAGPAKRAYIQKVLARQRRILLGMLYLTETAEGADRQQTIVDQLKEVLDTCL